MIDMCEFYRGERLTFAKYTCSSALLLGSFAEELKSRERSLEQFPNRYTVMYKSKPELIVKGVRKPVVDN